MKNLGILLFLILFSFCFNESDKFFDSWELDYPDDSTLYFQGDSHNLYYYKAFSNQPKQRIILLGFEKFQIIQKIIYFNVIFKWIYGNIFPKILILTIHIFNGNLRNLTEEIKTIECPRISKDDEDNIKFNCSKETNLDNIIKVSVDKNY